VLIRVIRGLNSVKEKKVFLPPYSSKLNIMNQKRLTRSVSNRVFAGICGGLGNYFDADPIIFRVLFIIFGLSGGGIIAYIIMMFLIPSESNFVQGPSSTGINDEWIGNVSKDVKEEIKDNVQRHSGAFSAIAGIFLVSLGFFLLVPWFHFRFIFPIALILFGILMLLLHLNRKF
jgi:phage shock protein PspC (stress-responsive transcriptional regulator)